MGTKATLSKVIISQEGFLCSYGALRITECVGALGRHWEFSHSSASRTREAVEKSEEEHGTRIPSLCSSGFSPSQGSSQYHPLELLWGLNRSVRVESFLQTPCLVAVTVEPWSDPLFLGSDSLFFSSASLKNMMCKKWIICTEDTPVIPFGSSTQIIQRTFN